MKIDLYTKIVLTIIAIALTVNLFKENITPANASDKKFVSIPVNPDGSINVVIKKSSDAMDVNIKDVDPYAFRYAQPLHVKLEQ